MTLIGPKRISELSPSERSLLIERFADLESVSEKVRKILDDVRRGGDEALIKYTELFDKVKLEPHQLLVHEDEIERARDLVDARLLRSLERVVEALGRFHSRQLPPRELCVETAPGCVTRLLALPLDSVGIYVPGGLHPYPSTALMLAVPARVAGVNEIAACTPPRRDGSVDPSVLAALALAGVKRVYRVGGVQALAALAFGTETVKRVDKIVGPGNVYVAAAKRELYGRVGVEMLAGPSEIVVVADESVDPKLVVLDMLAQLEHGPGSLAALIALHEGLARSVSEELRSSLSRLGLTGARVAVLIAESVEEAALFVNEIAPEHVELLLEQPEALAYKIKKAGSVALGLNTPIALCDYLTGANHVLPTSGAARFRGALTVYDFLSFVQFQEASPQCLREAAPFLEALAEAEGMKLHALSVRARVGSS
ncbi:MAG: histidinol dehydrogenase [Fervidicoccaceae archaeon]